MPRRPKDEPRDCFQTFRFTGAEITRLRARARTSGRSLSAYVRMILLEPQEPGMPTAPRPHGDEKPKSEQPAVQVLADQMRRVGVNLNQIVHRMNEMRTPPPELSSILSEIRTYVRRVREP